MSTSAKKPSPPAPVGGETHKITVSKQEQYLSLQAGETRTFEVGRSGRGRVRLPDVNNADAVYVTREARGGAQVPSEDPIVSVPL